MKYFVITASITVTRFFMQRLGGNLLIKKHTRQHVGDLKLETKNNLSDSNKTVHK